MVKNLNFFIQNKKYCFGPKKTNKFNQIFMIKIYKFGFLDQLSVKRFDTYTHSKISWCNCLRHTVENWCIGIIMSHVTKECQSKLISEIQGAVGLVIPLKLH